MRIEIKRVYPMGSNGNGVYFFKEKGQKADPTYVEMFIAEGDWFNLIKDELSQEERTAVTNMLINKKTDFESLSSAVLEKFVDYLKDNYPNLEIIAGYDDKFLENLIKLNKLNEEILPMQERHPLIPRILQRVNANKSIAIENKIQTLEHLILFLRNASDEQFSQFASKLAQLDQRTHHVSDLLKAIASLVSGWVLGLGFIFLSSLDIAEKKADDGTALGLILGLLCLGTGSSAAYMYGSSYLNNDVEDKYYPEQDKIVEIGNLCSKM